MRRSDLNQTRKDEVVCPKLPKPRHRLVWRAILTNVSVVRCHLFQALATVNLSIWQKNMASVSRTLRLIITWYSRYDISYPDFLCLVYHSRLAFAVVLLFTWWASSGFLFCMHLLGCFVGWIASCYHHLKFAYRLFAYCCIDTSMVIFGDACRSCMLANSALSIWCFIMAAVSVDSSLYSACIHLRCIYLLFVCLILFLYFCPLLFFLITFVSTYLILCLVYIYYILYDVMCPEIN